MKSGHIFYTFCPTWIQFRAQDAHRYLLATMGFVKISTVTATPSLGTQINSHLCFLHF